MRRDDPAPANLLTPPRFVSRGGHRATTRRTGRGTPPVPIRREAFARPAPKRRRDRRPLTRDSLPASGNPNRGGRIRTGDLLLPKRSNWDENHGRISRKSNWGCTICASCRWGVSGSAGLRKRENRFIWRAFGECLTRYPRTSASVNSPPAIAPDASSDHTTQRPAAVGRDSGASVR